MTKGPVRLHKPVNNDDDDFYSFINSLIDMVEAWILNHATLCLLVFMALLIALFVTVMFLIVGVSATESGVVYNHMKSMI